MGSTSRFYQQFDAAGLEMFGVGRADEASLIEAVIDERCRCIDIVLTALHKAVALCPLPHRSESLEPVIECLTAMRDGKRIDYDPREVRYPLKYAIDQLVKSRTAELEAKIERLTEVKESPENLTSPGDGKKNGA